MNLLNCLPVDLDDALLVGRVWLSAPVNGPSVVVVRQGHVFDVTAHVPTVSDLLDRDDCVDYVLSVPGEPLGSAVQIIENSLDRTAVNVPTLRAPCDLQVVKASGVTFMVSLFERIIEEKAGGDASKARDIRASLQEAIGAELTAIRPGSPAAMKLKQELVRRDEWSQYLEVAIGPDAEIFSKSPIMSSVGFGEKVGLHPSSAWNNPEPEIVLAVNSRGETVGASLGNDVNLRDFEGRSALLLGKDKDNNASCSIGPFIRLFDASFSIDDVRRCTVNLRVDGPDGFELLGSSSMAQISRDPLDLVAQAMGAYHQYPDGMMLFLGTLYAPTQDRAQPGSGFTHKLGDVVHISSAQLGSLVNEVNFCDHIAPWTFGLREFFTNLSARGILARPTHS